MTIEEKAKAYDEVLSKAREYHFQGQAPDKLAELESIFPVLKESEDERIRNEILLYIGSKQDIDLDTHNRWCAYLEKHKEQKSAEWSEEDKARIERIVDVLDWAEEKGRISYSDWEDYVCYVKSLKPQSKQAWSKEDEKWINYFYSLLGLACEKDIYGLGKKAIDAKMWLKSFSSQPGWKPSKEQIEALKSYTEDSACLNELYDDLKKL